MPSAILLDLDGTLTSVELLPLIAEELGLKEEIADLTRRTMAGELPFDSSFRHRVEMLGTVPIDRVSELVRSAPVHEELLDWVKANRERCWVVTGNLDCWVSPWLRDHGLRGFTSKSNFDGGRVGVEHILHKQSVLENFTGYQTVMVGDGANDAQLIAEADIGVAAALVHDVPPVVLEVADYLAMSEGTLCRILSRL